MKLSKIIISLWFITNFSFASDKVCPSGCGQIEHVFSKNIVNLYATQHQNSGLTINDDNEEVPANIVQAVILFGQDTQLVDNDGVAIIPQPFKDTQNMVLPMYKSKDFMLKKSIVATVALDNNATTTEILNALKSKYNNSKKVINRFELNNVVIAQDGIMMCQPCSYKKNK